MRNARQLPEATAVLQDFKGTHDADILAWLGLLQDEAGEWKAGEKSHRAALELAPDRDDLHNNLGYCLLEQGKKSQAADEFRAALRINKNSIFAHNNLGVALASSSGVKGSPEAVSQWQSVADPATAHSNMAAVLMESGKYTEARKEIGLALGYNRQHPAALTNLQSAVPVGWETGGVLSCRNPDPPEPCPCRLATLVGC